MPVETSESKSECIRRMKTCLSKLETEAGRLKGAPSCYPTAASPRGAALCVARPAPECLAQGP
jgi:hypothetical protein